MSLKDFEGYTFIAYMDISGFKAAMNEGNGINVLDKFYSSSYRILRNYREISSFLISDCGLLYLDQHNNFNGFETLLKAIKEINIKMHEQRIMLTTSISYGYFKYENRLEYEGMNKNPIYGEAYVNAYMDNEHEKPKIRPGQCRIIEEGLPFNIDNMAINSENNIFKYIKRKKRDKTHYYFYWMLEDHNESVPFEEKYIAAYKIRNKTGYNSVLEVLRAY